MFCDIVAGRSAADVVFVDELVTAFLDRSPLFPGHTLVVPSRHVVELRDLPADTVGAYFRRVQLLAAVVPDVLGAAGSFVAMNNVVSQSVAHLHVHVVPRRKGDGLRGFFWPRQRYEPGESANIAADVRRGLDAFDADQFLSGR